MCAAHTSSPTTTCGQWWRTLLCRATTTIMTTARAAMCTGPLTAGATSTAGFTSMGLNAWISVAAPLTRYVWLENCVFILSLRSWRIRLVNRLGFVFTEYLVHLLRGRLQDQEPLCRDPEIQLSERLLLGGPELRAMVRHGDRRFRPPCQVCLSSVCNLHSSSCFSRVPHLTNLESKLVWRFMIE